MFTHWGLQYPQRWTSYTQYSSSIEDPTFHFLWWHLLATIKCGDLNEYMYHRIFNVDKFRTRFLKMVYFFFPHLLTAKWCSCISLKGPLFVSWSIPLHISENWYFSFWLIKLTTYIEDSSSGELDPRSLKYQHILEHWCVSFTTKKYILLFLFTKENLVF